MSTIVRAALTETKNAYPHMPETVEGLGELEGKLGAIREANLTHGIELAAKAAEAGARILCLGELFTAPYFALTRHPMWRGLAEDVETGPSLTPLCQSARSNGLILIAPIYELDSESGKRFNTAVVIDETGAILGRYRKTHVPEGSNESASFHEGFYYEPSDGRLGSSTANVSANPFFPVFETSIGRVGIAICYDRHFPGAIRSLARAGAQIVFCPAVTFGAKSERMWEMEFQVDACRHRIFIGGSNRRGAEKPWNVEFFGRSHFVGPAGRVSPLSSAPGLVVADLDLRELEGEDPSGWDLRRDERPDAYS